MSNLKQVSGIQKIRTKDESKKVNQVTLDSIKDAKKREIYIRGYDKDNKGPKIGKRHIQAFLICMGITLGYAMRTSFSVAIVAMTDRTASPNPDIPTYNWKNQSVILSSFFWGYVCLQVLAGYLGNIYGPKNFLLPSFAINSAAFLLIPLAADKSGPTGVIICRVIQGLTQGFLFPSAHTILGKWAPVEERATMGVIVYTGVSIGPILSSLIAGYVSSSWIGWPAAFYIMGLLGLAWCVLYFFLGFNTPAVHPTITKEERDYIQSSLEETGSDEARSIIPVPWKSILTNLPVIAILVCSMGGAWGYSMMMTQIPTYLAKVMKFEISSNGLATAIPYMASLVSGFIYAPLSDYLIRKGYISTLNSRRLFQLIGSYGQLTCLLLLTYVAKTKTAAVLFLSIGNSLYIAVLAGHSINHVDISPRFCGIIQGICNGCSQIMSIFAPLLVQFSVQQEKEADQWKVVFLVTVVIYFVCATFFAIFASATRQPWDGPITEEPEKIERMKKQSLGSLSGYYPILGARYIQIILIAYCILVGISTRASFAVQIVAMTATNSSSPNPGIPVYSNWQNSHVVLSSFYWLYVVSNLICSPLEKKFGAKWFFLGAIFLNCVAYSFIPLMAQEFGEIGVLICRLVQGLGSGFMYPTQQMLIGVWAPPEERSRAIISVNTGVTVGTMLSSIIPGLLTPTWWGWPSSFYIIGVVGLVWCVLYLLLGHESPATHPSITPEERKYIQQSLNQDQDINVPVPYMKIITSIRIWAVLVAQIGVAWSNNMALTEYASYLDKVMGFDIQSNGTLSAVPPAVGLFAGFIVGPLSDFLINRKYLSTVNARRQFHLTGALGISISLTTLSYLKQSQQAASIFLMVVVYVSQAAMVCGSGLNMIDLSPRFAGVIFGISNASGQSIALFAPLVVQFVVTEETDITQWRIVFIASAVLVLGSALFFVIFASAERQPWDGPEIKVSVGERRRKKISVISLSGDIAVICS
ncbi:uncharacterized protein [Euwallacea fornicatus]|uniref:uncharacterized protein n=1 Tax=Euwallacea fornicatus TaxID=995702 RepID=UPI00339064E4